MKKISLIIFFLLVLSPILIHAISAQEMVFDSKTNSFKFISDEEYQLQQQREKVIISTSLIILAIVLILQYIFSTIVFYKIGKKENQSIPWISIIPILGPLIISYSATKKAKWLWYVFSIGLIGTIVSYFIANESNWTIVMLFPFLFILSIGIGWRIWNWNLHKKYLGPKKASLILIPIVGYILYLKWLKKILATPLARDSSSNESFNSD